VRKVSIRYLVLVIIAIFSRNNFPFNKSLQTIAKRAGIVLLGTVIGRVVGFLSRMVIARFLRANDYGLITLGFAAMSIVATLSLIGMCGIRSGISQGYVQGSGMRRGTGCRMGLRRRLGGSGGEGIKTYVEWVNLEYPIIKAHEKWIPWLKQR